MISCHSVTHGCRRATHMGPTADYGMMGSDFWPNTAVSHPDRNFQSTPLLPCRHCSGRLVHVAIKDTAGASMWLHLMLSAANTPRQACACCKYPSIKYPAATMRGGTYLVLSAANMPRLLGMVWSCFMHYSNDQDALGQPLVVVKCSACVWPCGQLM